jgi:transmembrane sensor
MPNDDQNDWTLLTRYLAGECTSAEAAEVERRLAADPALQEELAELRRLWDQAGSLPSGSRIEAMWRDLTERMEGAEPAAPVTRPTLRVVPHQVTPGAQRVRIAAGLAAALAFAVGGTAVWKAGRDAPVAVAAPVEREFSTAPGQRAEITLADGSHVQLGVASKMTVRLFDGGRREVNLDGEAVFEVVHDERRPFLVYTANAVTEDLGTEFGVRAYRTDTDVQVVVVSGKVSLRPAGQTRGGAADSAGALLGPNDLGLLGTDGRTTVRRVDPARYLAWTTGRLVFRQARLSEVAVQLQRWYGVSIEIPESIATRRVTLDMPVLSLASVLDAVTVPLNLRYTTTAQRVVLHP